MVVGSRCHFVGSRSSGLSISVLDLIFGTRICKALFTFFLPSLCGCASYRVNFSFSSAFEKHFDGLFPLKSSCVLQ